MKNSGQVATRVRKVVLTFHLLFITLLLCTVSARADYRHGIISYWPLDVIDSGTTPDLTFTNTMSVAGSPVVSPGKFGNAFTFTNNIYLTNLHPSDAFPSAGLPIFSAGSYTICMWVKGPPQQAKYLYTEGNLTNTTPLFILQTGNTSLNVAKLDILIRNDAGGASGTLVDHRVSTSVVFDDTWHHIAWVDNNGNARLYVDGQLDGGNFVYNRSGSFTFSSSAIATLVRTSVSGNNVFSGQIDDVAIWERPLTQEEVQAVMANSIATPLPSATPHLHVEPVSTNRHWGDWAIFTARAYSYRPYNNIGYQWFKNGSEITDATNRTYQTEHLTTANTGDYYSVRVSNGVGSPVDSTNAVITVTQDPAVDVARGLLNYWPLDIVENTDGFPTTPDLYSHASMALTNQMSELNLVPGRIGQALLFDGITNIAYRTSGSAISINPSYSVSMWVQSDYQFQNDRRVFSEGTTANNPLFTLGTQAQGANASASVFVRPDSGGALINSRASQAPVFDNNWHHIVWTEENGQGRLYIDGVLDFTDYTYTPAPRAATITSLGGVMRSGTGNFYYGMIDEVAAWNRALTWSEVQDIYANGIPAPVAEIPPGFVLQPTDRTNNVWVGQDITFTTIVSGTAPSLQWYKDDQPISSAINPTATNTTLSLTNIQMADNGLYWLTASNSMGKTNSTIVRLLAQNWVPTLSGEVLKLDVGLDGSANLEPGFEEFTLAKNGSSYGVVGVTLSPIGSIGFAARNRVVDGGANFVTDSPPGFIHASIYNDFIYANSSVAGNGMRILIERLAPNTPYGVTLWCYDRNSTGDARVSDWIETSSGAEIPVALNYSFQASAVPTNNYQYTMGGVFTSSASGKLQFEGRVVSGGISVFFNGLRLVAQPAGTSMRTLGMVDGNLMTEVVGDYQGQPITIQESTSLTGASWGPAQGATPVLTNGPAVIYQLPVSSSGSKFYRAASQPPQ